jgi:hypothetical protein
MAAKKRYYSEGSESKNNPLHVHAFDKQYPMGDAMHGEYEGLQQRRRQEMEDAGMIKADYSAIANLPQNVMIKPYPKTGPYNPEILDDTIRAVDDQMDGDDKGRAKVFAPHKY